AEEVDFYRLRLSGEEEINGNIYKKCWCYTDCEFDESTAVLYGYLREENKRVYVLYQNAGSGYLLYDFNLQEGDEYGQHPWFNGAVTLPIESVDYVLTTEGLRKRYFVGSNVCYIEGIGIVGTHLGDMLRPNDYPYVENATFNYEKNQGNNVVYQQTDNEIGFTDPCINYGVAYEYTPLVREGVVWHYSDYGELYKFSFIGEEEINGKIYRKCYKFDENSDITESNGTLIAYLREENRQVYSIFDDSEETMIYDFNLKVSDIYNSLYNQFAITAIDYVSINNCLTKRFQLERENEWIVEGVGVVSELGHYFFCPFYPTPSGIGMSLPPVLYKQTTIDGQVLVSYTWNSIEKVTQNELLISQAENVVTINGATGKVNVAIYTFDGLKVAEASGSESVGLSTAELPIGIYLVKATDSTGNRLTQKIVVK
ncbi:MAG: T9SS type A sorting domain-containing protein, partial [Muribaculaceae bacterium]|nr:T9SS type A sorting domain-containing protein [Muribaculaceae bacterium]